MKHSLRRIRCLLLFLAVLTVSLLPMNACAEDASAELRSLNFDIVLLGDGSAFITETREVSFRGDRDFTRYGVINRFAGPRSFWGWQVTIDGVPAQQLDEPDNENRPENTFAVEDGDGENTVYIYFRQSGNGTRVFEISYWVENAVKLHSDVGEFPWNLTGESGISDIGKLTATLIVPEGIADEDFKIWAHGPLNGSFDKQPDGTAYLQVENVPLGTIIDIRVTLPADCFYGGWEQPGEALSDILAEEKALSDSANAKREEEERLRAEWQEMQDEANAKREAWAQEHPIQASIEWFCQDILYEAFDFLEEYGKTLLVIIFLAGPVLRMTGVLRILSAILRRINKSKFKKSPTQSPKYYRDLPDNRPAPVVDRLIHFYDNKANVSRQLSATLLELNLKKLIHLQTVDGDAELLLNEQLGEEMFPSAAPQETEEPEQGQEHVPGYQELLWVFLRNAAGEDGRITIEELKKHIKDNWSEALSFRRSFEEAVGRDCAEWIKSKDTKQDLPKAFRIRLIISAAAGLLVMLICALALLYEGIEVIPTLGYGLIAFVAVLVVLSILHAIIKHVVKRSSYTYLEQQSEDDLALWNAFGRFLNDFTTFNEKELPEFSVWREYMVYAVVMGKGQKVAKALSVKYPDAFSEGTNTINDDDMYRWMQDMALFEAMESIGREVAEARVPVSSSSSSDSNDYSNYSDADGGGGGFSDSGGGSDSGSGGDFID